MPQREILYLPPEGDGWSPETYLDNLLASERAKIDGQLETIAGLLPYEWSGKWVKNVSGLYQLTSGNHRLYFLLDGKDILVVYYACLKTSQQAHPYDLARAKENRDLYYSRYKREKRR